MMHWPWRAPGPTSSTSAANPQGRAPYPCQPKRSWLAWRQCSGAWPAGCACPSQSTPTRLLWPHRPWISARPSSTTSARSQYDPALPGVVARTRAVVSLMHTRGQSRTMYRDAHYDDVVREVCAELGERLRHAAEAGIPLSHVLIDPGIGFAKRAEHSARCLRASKHCTPSVVRSSSVPRESRSCSAPLASRPQPRAIGEPPPRSLQPCWPVCTWFACTRCPRWWTSCASPTCCGATPLSTRGHGGASHVNWFDGFFTRDADRLAGRPRHCDRGGPDLRGDEAHQRHPRGADGCSARG